MRPWCPQGSTAIHYSSTSYCEIDVMRFGPVDARNVHLSNRLTWSTCRLLTASGFVMDFCWVLNCKPGVVPKFMKVTTVIGSWKPSFSYTWNVRVLEVNEDTFGANGHQYQFHGDRQFTWEDGTIQTLESIDRTPATSLHFIARLFLFFPTLSSSN